MTYIVWDWNGTLFDDLDLCLYCINRLLTDNGYEQVHTYEQYRKVFCFPIKQYYLNAGFKFDKKSFEELAQEYMDIYLPMAHLCKLNKDAKEVINEFNQKGYKQVILTASKINVLKEQLEPFNIKDKFDLLLGTDNIYCHSKAQLAEKLLQRIDKNDKIYFIGDSLHDAEVGKILGAQIILYEGGHQFLPDSEEYCKVKTLKEISERIN